MTRNWCNQNEGRDLETQQVGKLQKDNQADTKIRESQAM